MSHLLLFRRRAALRGWSHASAHDGPERRRRRGIRRRRRWGRRRRDRHVMTAVAVLAFAVLASAMGTTVRHGLVPVDSVDALSDMASDIAAPAGNKAGRPFSGQVVSVLDGDTFRLDCCYRRIRLWGIDAPERRTRTGPAATAALRALIAGRTLACRQRDIDRYGRIVGQCTLADGSDLGARLLATGTVREYCHFSRNHYRTC